MYFIATVTITSSSDAPRASELLVTRGYKYVEGGGGSLWRRPCTTAEDAEAANARAQAALEGQGIRSSVSVEESG